MSAQLSQIWLNVSLTDCRATFHHKLDLCLTIATLNLILILPAMMSSAICPIENLTMHNLTPQDLFDGLSSDRYVLIDVREADEFEQARIDGAHLHPLSILDPSTFPKARPDQTIVLMCLGGVRSVRAAHYCQGLGVMIDHHLAGGLKAWAASGLPLKTDT